MQIFIANISQIVEDRALEFQLTYLHLTLAISKRQGQGQAHLNFEYLVNGDKKGKHYYCHHI